MIENEQQYEITRAKADEISEAISQLEHVSLPNGLSLVHGAVHPATHAHNHWPPTRSSHCPLTHDHHQRHPDHQGDTMTKPTSPLNLTPPSPPKLAGNTSPPSGSRWASRLANAALGAPRVVDL